MKKVKPTLIKAVALAILCFSGSAMAERVLLKTPVAFGTHLPAMGTPIKWVSERIQQISGNTIDIKIYEPGKLVAPLEILDAVSSGKASAGYSTAGYWQEKMPAAALFSAVPFGPEAPEYMAWLFYGNGLELYQGMYDEAGYNVKVLPCAIISPETSGWFKKPIDKPEDLKGLTMRFFGLGARVMERLGVSTVQLSGGEIFGALEKGEIDASEFSQPAIDQRLGFHQIVKYNYFPGWHQQATVFELLVNRDVWNDMDENQQTTLELLCMASITNSMAEGESMQFEAMQKAQEQGVELRYWNNEMLSLFESTWLEVVEEQKKDPYFAKVWADMSQFRKNYQVWEARGFLPRSRN